MCHLDTLLSLEFSGFSHPRGQAAVVEGINSIRIPWF